MTQPQPPPQPDPQHIISAQAEELARLLQDRIWLLARIKHLEADLALEVTPDASP